MEKFKVEPDYSSTSFMSSMLGKSNEFKPELGCMPGLWKHYNSGDMAIQPYCIIDNQAEKNGDVITSPCTKAETRAEIFAKKPYPQILTMNISWFDNQIRYDEAFKFAMAIATQFCIRDMFNVDPDDLTAEDTIYKLKGVVCFVGAHYFSFIRQQSDMQEWLYYDDDKPIQIFPTWESVLDNILRFGYMPCLLIYERVVLKGSDLLAEKPLS